MLQAAVGLQPVSKRTSSYIANIIVVLQSEREPSRPLPASSPQTKKYNDLQVQDAVGCCWLSAPLLAHKRPCRRFDFCPAARA
jgi:hypothetical protein